MKVGSKSCCVVHAEMNHDTAVVFLMGPTASGKTALAVELCDRFPFEIISVDSAMVYRGMDIGTAKPDAAVLARAPHRLIDICDPGEVYSAGDFRDDALAAIDAIHGHGRIPLLVGGTGLYFRALEWGIADLPPADDEIRRQLAEQAAKSGPGGLHRQLALVDPQAAARIHPNDPQRIQRALEVYRISGRPLSSFFAGKKQRELPFRTLKLIVSPENRGLLHERIAERFEKMMEFGLIEEVKGLYQRGDLHADMPSMRVVGYRQVWQYLEGTLAAEELAYRGIVATRQLAKRQLTWLRAERDGAWFDSGREDFVAKIHDFLAANPILTTTM